jgi:hypothetical protein
MLIQKICLILLINFCFLCLKVESTEEKIESVEKIKNENNTDFSEITIQEESQKNYTNNELTLTPGIEIISSVYNRSSIFWNSRPIKFLKGTPDEDAIYLGMWSKHTKKQNKNKRKRNEEHHLIGLQYNGVFLSYFKNSHHNPSIMGGFARNLFVKELYFKGLNFTAGYRVGLLHGYRDQYPNVLGITPLVVPVVNLNYKCIGVSGLIIPAARPVLAIGTRLNISYLTRKVEKYLNVRQEKN